MIIMATQKIKITADSTCDLSPQLLERYQISIVPLYINMEGKSYKDGVDVQVGQLFDFADRTGTLATTSAASVQDYLDAFRPFVEDGYMVIHINISSHFSSSHQNARLAAQELGNVYVVDSLNLSTGTGHIVLEAAIRAQQGMAAQQIVDELQDLIPRVESSFVIDTLKYLHKGGRCSTVAALGANLLKLKPCIEVRDGKMSVGKKYRGNWENVLEQYVTDRLTGREDIEKGRIFITHTPCSENAVKRVARKVKEIKAFDEMQETDAGCTIANHCGPNTLGILFIRKK